jgi:succinate dehydrogenase / fumarate reductase cytochrome b subunit
MNKSAPVYLNLFKIKLPLTGIISFLHRITGVLLFFSIPLSIYTLQRSLQSEAAFNALVTWLNSPLMIIVQVIVISALFYHFFAGIRFLLMDLDIGYDKKMAERSSWLVLSASVLSALVFIVLRFLI